VFRRANNVDYFWQIDNAILLVRGKVRTFIQIGSKKYFSKELTTKAKFREKRARSESAPQFYLTVKGVNYWRYMDKWYADDDGLEQDEVLALINSYDLQLKKKISEAKTASAAGRAPDGSLREMIPEDVRHAVWQRDAGACRLCGATSDLQYDHLIPVSMGGANSVDNLQILCGPCNRRKGASVV